MWGDYSCSANLQQLWVLTLRNFTHLCLPSKLLVQCCMDWNVAPQVLICMFGDDSCSENFEGVKALEMFVMLPCQCYEVEVIP